MNNNGKSAAKNVNKLNVLSYFTEQNELSRKEIGDRNKLSAATNSALIAELEEEGWISVNRIGDSSGGRRPVYYHLDCDKAFVVSLRITTKGVIIGIVNMRCEIVYSKTFINQIYNEKALTELLTSVLAELYKDNSHISRNFCAMAISCPGIINYKNCVLMYSLNMHIRNYDIKKTIYSCIANPIPVYLYNDSDALLLGEYYFNDNLRGKSLAYILCESGVGFALINDGQLFRPNGMGMELGHMSINLARKDYGFYPAGGYLGKNLSETPTINGYFQYYNEMNPGVPPSYDPVLTTYSDIINLYIQGDPVAFKVITEQIDLLSWVISNVVDLFNPDTVIIGSVLTQLGQKLEDTLIEKVRQRAIDVFTENLTICNAKFGFNSSLIGMSKNVFHQMFFSV